MPTHDGELSLFDGQDADRCPSIVVAVLTYQRSDLLERLLAEFSRIELSSNMRTTLLVVDNDENGSARTVVEAHRNQIPELHYVVEPTSGIPCARNRAINEALSLQADVLCFIDDDEYPDQQWLVKLVETWRQSPANLIGGPVSVAPADASRDPTALPVLFFPVSPSQTLRADSTPRPLRPDPRPAPSSNTSVSWISPRFEGRSLSVGDEAASLATMTPLSGSRVRSIPFPGTV
tara:strand:- start:182 stop:883 length:702 start_codon:yes stop_codon:yes gene_type:complete